MTRASYFTQPMYITEATGFTMSVKRNDASILASLSIDFKVITSFIGSVRFP